MDEHPPPTYPPPTYPPSDLLPEAEPTQPPYAPPPVPPAEDVSGRDEGGRFKTVVAVLIAVTSILSAVVAWRASVSSTLAGDFDEQATQELVREQQERASIEGQLATDRRLFARYQEHILAWRVLQKQSRDERQSNPGLADVLDMEASAELALARSLRPLFQSFAPDFGDEEGNVVFDREVAANFLESYSELPLLDPEARFAAAQDEHRRTIRLVGVFTLIVLALFFLTIAQFAGPAVRGLFAVAGVVVVAGGAVLFVLFEWRIL